MNTGLNVAPKFDCFANTSANKINKQKLARIHSRPLPCQFNCRAKNDYEFGPYRSPRTFNGIGLVEIMLPIAFISNNIHEN